MWAEEETVNDDDRFTCVSKKIYGDELASFPLSIFTLLTRDGLETRLKSDEHFNLSRRFISFHPQFPRKKVSLYSLSPINLRVFLFTILKIVDEKQLE